MNYRFLNEIPKDDYCILQQVGSGTFSDIFSATHLKTNTNVALKIFLKNNQQDYDKSIDQEVKINKCLHHPFICKFFNEFETEHLNIIVMELIEGMTLLDYVNQTHGLPPPEVSNLFSQLLIVIEYLHNEVHITHRDLKLENIMVDNCGHIRLIDFGFSTRKSLMSTLCGSIPYCAPEVLAGQLYTRASDIWSMGIILYALFDGNLPFFHHNTNILVSLICNRELTVPDTFDGALKDLLIGMLNKDPEQRIKLDDIKQHPFVNQEKLFQIDYKSLFSPIDKPHDQIHQSMTEQTIREDNGSKLGKPQNLTVNINSQVRKSGFFRNANSTFNLSDEAIEILHEKITLKTDDIDLLIENRKNFAHNLTKLIESTYYRNLYQTENDTENNLGTSLSDLTDNQLSLSSSQVIIPNGPLISLSANHPGTSDNLASFVNNRHYHLTNHFANLKNKEKSVNKSKPQFPNPGPIAKPPCLTATNRQISPPSQIQTPGILQNDTNSKSQQTLNGQNVLSKSRVSIVPPQLPPAVPPSQLQMNDKSPEPQKRQSSFMMQTKKPLDGTPASQNQTSITLKPTTFLTPHFIAKTHRRHSHSRALIHQPAIVSPIVNNSNNIFSDE